jgi:hypothetical protein
VGVGRLARHVGRQGAAPLDHHAQAAEAEHLDLHRGVVDHALHLLHRQHARQHRAHDAELLAVEVDGVGTGGRALHRQVQAQLGVVLRAVLHQAGVGQDDGVHAHVHGLVHGRAPGRGVGGLRVGVERHEDLAPRSCAYRMPLAMAASSKLSPAKLRALVASRRPR